MSFDGYPDMSYFDSPLTTATFDRTPQQREKRTEILVMLMQSMDLSPKEAEALTNMRMYSRFLQEVDESIEAQTQNLDAQGVDMQIGPRPGALRVMARVMVTEELSVLNGALPLPGLDQHETTEEIE